jgi:hypothetical protein
MRRFRVGVAPDRYVRLHADTAAAAEMTDEPHDLVRDERGFPLQLAARGRHIVARSAFFEAMAADTDAVTADRLVRQHELEDPAFFVEWYRSREA